MASAIPKETVPKRTMPRLLSRERLKTLTLLPASLIRDKVFSTKKKTTSQRSFLPNIRPRIELPPTPVSCLFQISPSEIVFRNYTADDVIETELFLINKDTFNRLVKVSMERSPYFELLCPNDAYHIVPPGASCPVRIRFTPKNNENYYHELICITGLERIVVPVRAIATRMRDFTEELNFSKCPVNHCTHKTLEIYNDTDQEARYHVNVEGPFSVDPETAILDPGETLEMTVRFHAEYTGDHFGMLAVCRNQGEKIVRTKLRGEAVNIKAVLSTNSVKFGKIFVNTSSEKIIFIENRSNVATFFQWKSFPTVEAEEDEKTRLRTLLRPKDGKWLHDFIKNRNIEDKEYCEKTIDLWRRKREEEIEKVQNDPLFFSNEFFSIEPKEGNIEPHCRAEIKVTFKPQETRDYEYKAYCIIAGRDTRVALKLTGQGEGPMVELSNPTLNLGDVLVNTTHTYEVKLINQGGVDAPFTYIPSTKDLGDCFKFAPEEGIIAPGRIQTIQISFKITTLGNFEQEFQFSVAGSKTPAILTITGCVCPATVEFNKEELDFGDISFGFPYSAVCRLINTSPGSLTFKVRMSQDGRQPAISACDQILKPNDSAWRDGIHFYLEPKEFSLNPSQGTILPQGYRDIQVTLCSNTVTSFYRRLLVDLEGFGTEMAKLVITARCVVPDLRVSPQIQEYSQCLLKVPYTRKFFIANPSHLPACYRLIPQDRNEDTPVLYSSPKPCGIIEPHSIEEISVVIEVQAWGDHSTEGFIGVFGDERYPRSIILRSSGRLADIYTVPREIDFGRIQVLEPNSQSLTLFNEGLAPVDFRMEVVRKPHCYVIEPREGVIPARGEVPVTITATLDDIGVFADTIQLFIWNTPWMTCLVRALGTGTAIVIDKPFGPELNFGYQFSFLPCTHQFKVTNRSPHSHRLSWSVEHDNHSISALSSSTTEDLSQSSKHTFWLEPRLIELQPGESVDVVLQGVSRVAQEVQQRVICKAVVKDRRKEKIAETTIICKFIDPSLEISTREISFWVEKKPSDVLALQYKPLALKNTCCLPLDLMLDLEKPFLVCGVDLQPLPDGKPVTVDAGQTCHLYVAFDPAYKIGFHSWKDKKVLKINMVKDHRHVEHITLLGEVYFPNLEIQSSTLDFGCIVAGTEEVRCLQMTNCSPLPVQYHWSFQLDSHVNQFKHELYPPKFLPQPPRMKRTCLPLSSQWRRFKMTNREETASLLKETVDLAQSLAAEVPPGTAESHSPLELKKFRLSIDVPYSPLKVDKAFSILPQLGELQPGKSQRVIFTFSGHLNTIASATALCHVEGGPTYKVELTGEASRISYSLSLREIDCGCQMFNEIHHCSVTLANTGKIEFNWALNLSTAEQHLPGMFLVNPAHGSIARGEQQVLKFSYMPGIPGAFSRTFQLKVAELYLDNICLKGEASFPMIGVNLPWTIKGNEKYKKPLKQHVKPLQQCNQRNKSVAQKKTRSSKTLKSRTPKTQTVKTQTPKTRTLKTQNLNPQVLGSDISSSIKLQVETVMNLIKKPALELQKKFPSHHSNSRFPDKELCQNLVKVELPEYVLDMGTVLKGNTETRTLMIINPGQIPVSFQAKVSALENTGFRVNLDHMKGLLHNQTRILEVCFDSAYWAEGGVDVLLPIKVAKGPTYNIRLCATVLELSLDLSKDTLQFSDILVGQCQIETVRLYNKFQVPCKWFIMSVKPDKKHKQRKYWTPAVGQKQQEDKSCPFQVTPSKGTLDPGSWQNLQIQFTPKEQRFYKNELKLNICDSRHCLKLHLSGKGLEAQLEFSPPALKMDWVLVDSDGLDTTVVVKNPCNFPVEFYSLDFDEQYLEEEKILRMVVGSEYQKNFLMPPRAMGGTLPSEVLEDYEAQKRLKAQQAELRAMADAMATAEAQAVDKAAPAYHGTVTPSPEPMVEVTGNPISRAVMRHMGIDPSSERCEAQDRGIVFIVHGPPRTGKTEVAAALCHYYDAAHLSIDTVVKETIASHQNEAGCRAQELCTNAAMELKSEDEGNAGIKSQITAQSRNKLASVDKNNKKNAKGKSPSAQKRKETASKLDKKFTVATAPAPQQLNIISSHGEEMNCLSCVLPEDLLVDILCERLKREDCYKGVVFDGLESLFASSLDSSLLCVFKAVKNRRHIYVVNLHQDYGSWITKQESERNMREAKREMEELQQKKAFQRNMERILKMDEDEYDALSEERRALVDKIILGRKALRRERERKQLARKLEEEARALEEEERQKEEERRKEEERLKKQKKRASLGKQPAKQEKKETKSPEKKTKPPDKMETKAPEKKETKIPEKKEIKSPGRKETKIPPEKGEPIAPEEKETRNLEDEITKMLEDSINKFLEDEITEILEEETGSPEKEETKSPEKGETKASEKRKTKASKKSKAPGKGESKAPGKGEPEAPEWGVPEAPGKWEPEASGTGVPKAPGNGEPEAPEKEEPKVPEKEEPKAPKKGESKTPKNGDTRAPGKREAEIPEYPDEMDNLIQRFQIYESSQQDIAQVLTYFDRIQGTMQLPVIQNGNISQPSAESKGQKTNKPPEKVEKKPEQKSGGQRSLQSSRLETQSEVAEGSVRDEHVEVPCLDIHITNPEPMIKEILSDKRLPTKEEMLRYLGLHPEGPPLPPAAVFSIVNYPEERLVSAECVKLFTIAAPEGAAMEDNLPHGRRLKRYRWIVPSHGEVELKVHFSTGKPGKFEQALRFELVESKRLYELPCSCTGLYPSICQNPRRVFPKCRETKEADEIIFKEYVKSTKQFHFGPLLCGKSREWYKAQNCPGNSENITILNNSPVVVEVHFYFENDGKAETFLLDPPSMTLKPEEKQELTIWAYPTSPGFLEDRLICCIEKNPEPVVFGLCCHGVHVKLEVSPLELSFDKLLLHRTDSRTLVLKNDTLLPMAWQFSGLDDLVETFSLSQDNGIIDPRSEFEVTLNFKAEKIGIIEKILRLEVSDTENILGIVQAENIEISAEVYDVSLSIDMPEGPDGSLEFGTINVLDNVKKVLTLRNKGMYKIGYCFILKGTGPRTQDLASHFTVEPWSGVLIASQPGVNIEMVFQPKREMLLKSRPILYCQVTDASSGEGGQTVATIPVRVSAKAVYSKYSIEPASPIDFGAMIKGSRKTQTVLLENKGMLSFKFCIQQAPKDASASAKQLESPALTTKLKSSSTQDHLNLGMFMVSPCSGSIAPWGQQKITVDCLARQEGKFEEQLYIDITGRDTTDNPLGIPFTLIAESCLPAFIDDVMLTFEEYPICSSTNLCHKLQSVRGTGLFVRDENKFIFTRVLVGEQAEANFNIYNASGMPCDVVLSIKPLPGKEKSPINNIFKLCPVKMSIPGSSKAVATVTFTPPDQQSYECTFKASLVIPKSSVKIKPQTMTFTITGKGHEPQVSIVCPSARSKRGNVVLRFKRLRVGDSEMLPLVVSNNSVLPVKFMLHLEDEHGAFFLKGRPSTLEYFHTEDVEEDWIGNESKSPKKPFFLLRCGQSTEFDAIFKPNVAQRLEGKIRVLVGNVYKSLIELVGEGHEDEFTLDGLEEDKQERNADSSLKKDIIDAVRVNYMQFGDCPVGKPCRRTFTITNHSHRHAMRFQWDADAVFWFSPKMGHLHPGCAKDITVTLKSDVPAVFRRHLVKCKVSKIKFGLPRRKVQDWDDQMTIVTWKDTTKKDPEATWPKKEKIVQTAPEPAYTVVDESSQEVEVYLSAFVAYTQFKLSTIVIQLKDTLTNQTSAATFSMHNTGKIALEYTWMEAKDSEPVTKPYSPILMRKFLSPATLKYRKRLLDHFWWEQDHPFETYPSELQQRQQLAKQQHHSQQQQQDSDKNQQPSEKQQQQSEQQQQPSEQQQSSEEEQLDSKQKKHPKKQRRSKEQNLSQQQQPSEQQQSSEEEQLDSKQKKHPKKQRCSKEQHPSEQQQPSEQQHEQPKQQEEHPEQQEEQPKQQEEQSEKQQPKHRDHAEKLHHSMQKHLSLKHVSSSMEIFPDFIHDLPLFSLNPYHGIIAPGQKQIFQVLFSPKCAGTFETTMVCRIPNLKPDLRKARVIVKGRAREQKSFDKPKRSALRQTEKGQGPKKQVHWKPTLE